MYTEKDLAGKTVEELVKIIIEQGKVVSDKQTEITDKIAELTLTSQVNQELIAKVEELSKNAPAVSESKSESGISKEDFTVGKRTFGFKKLRVDHKNQVITAAEVLADKKLQEELVKIGSGLIYEKPTQD